MAGREVEILETFSFPLLYSFCASIIMRTLSEGEAVEGGIPRISVLKEGAVEVVIFGGLAEYNLILNRLCWMEWLCLIGLLYSCRGEMVIERHPVAPKWKFGGARRMEIDDGGAFESFPPR